MEGERDARPAGKRRKFLPVTSGGGGGAPSAERAAMASALEKLSRREVGEGKLNVERAVNMVAAERAQHAGERRAAGGGGKPPKGGRGARR